MILRITADTKAAEATVIRLRDGMQILNIDRIVDLVAMKSWASLVEASPKKWFGQIKSGWKVATPLPGSRLIHIPENKKGKGGASVADIARFVNFGTANDGSGFIYPKPPKKFLYIPLKRTAVVWREGLVRGVDYVLAGRVHGIKGRHFIEPEREKAAVMLRQKLRDYIHGLVTKPTTAPPGT